MGSRGTACQNLCTDEDYVRGELEETDNSHYDSVRLIHGVFHVGGETVTNKGGRDNSGR